MKPIPVIPILPDRLLVPLLSEIHTGENSVLVHDDPRAGMPQRPQFDREVLPHHAFRLIDLHRKRVTPLLA